MKLNAKFSLFIVSAALIPSVFVMGTSLFFYFQQLSVDNIHSTQFRAIQAASKINKELNTAVHEVELYAQLPELKSMDPVRFLPLMISELYRHDGRYEKFIIGRKDGAFYNTSGGNPEQNWLRTQNDDDPQATRLNIRQRDYWQKTVEKNYRYSISTVSEPMISYTTGVKQIVVASSILDEEEVVIGMVGAAIEWRRMSELIEFVEEQYFADLEWKPKLFLTTNSGKYWYHWDKEKTVQLKRDADGQLVLNSDNQSQSVTPQIIDDPNPGYKEQFEVMKAGEVGYLTYTDVDTQVEKTLIHAPIEVAGYTLGVLVDNADLTRPIEQLIKLYTIAILGFLLVILLIFSVVSRVLTQPLLELIQTVKCYAYGDYEARFFTRKNDEIGDLGRTFNDMAKSIETREYDLKKSEERFDFAMKGANDGLWDWDTIENTVYFSPRWKEMLGYVEGDIGDQFDALTSLLHVDDKPAFNQSISAVLSGSVPHFSQKFRMRCKNGSFIHILSRAFPVAENGEVTRLVGTHVNITEQVELEQTIRKANRELEARVDERTSELQKAYKELEKISLQDGLLKIGNRHAMDRDLEIISNISQRYKNQYSIAMLDVDWFKRYNDLYGHPEGDQALIKVSECITELLRQSDRLYRYGGEELLLLMPNTNHQNAMECVERIRQAVDKLNIPHQQSPFAKVTVSIGVATTDHQHWQELLQVVDEALYCAKRGGRNTTIAAA